MNRGFPVRVNRRDADKHFHQKSFQKKPESDIKVFSQGARHYLHPALSILDRLDCELAYYKKDKIIVLSYEPLEENINNTDYTRKSYQKCLMSGEVDFIVDMIREYLDDKRKEREEYNISINSDVQSEPIDITTEDYPV